MIFSNLYRLILTWSEKKSSSYYLAFLSFVESFILPYPPPDILLAPLCLKHPKKSYHLAFITTIFSVIGGAVGYGIGYFSYDLILPFLEKMNYLNKLSNLEAWFAIYGIWTVAIAGFSPIPYKLFTILSGFLGLSFLSFVLISLASRGARFFLVALIVQKFGTQCDIWLKKYVDYLGYSVLLALLIYLFWS